MKTKLLLLLIIQLLSPFTHAQKYEKLSNKELIPNIKVYASGKVENYVVKAPERSKSKQQPTAVFEVTYTGFTEEAKAAFEKATEIWSYLISSPVPIKIDARWEVMETGVLGSSGPPAVYRNFKNAYLKDTWYYPSVANKLAGFDLDPESYDMVTRYNSTYLWYLGTDEACPFNKTDFVTIALHEIAHGLGFSSNAFKDGLKGSFGSGPAPWDYFMYNLNDELLIDTSLFDNPSTDLLAEFTSNEIYFNSPLSNEANGGVPAELYAPAIWNEGSSISHLAEIFNNTNNALMTYSAGTGEVLHNPGPITMGMLAEIGWVNVRFDFDRLKDMEQMTDPLSVSIEIFADSTVYTDSVFMHYSNDNFITDNKIKMSTLNDTLFSAEIPVINDDTINYYFEAKTKLERFYYYPSQGKLNIESVDSTLFFAIGPDNQNPQLIYSQETEYILDYEKTLELELEADDNLALDSVYIEYKINDNAVKSMKLQFIDENPIGLPKYGIQLQLQDENLTDSDTIFYKFIAVDKAQVANNKELPENGYYKVRVHSLFNAEVDTIIDFDQIDYENFFILDGFTIDRPLGFSNLGLHSPHPYEEGDGYPKNERNYSAMMKLPIIINDTAEIAYDEIVIVEPGASGTVFGDSDFWDYVIVEGSKDSGKTWHEFADGYDSRIATSFVTAYNSNAQGTSSMFKSHTINLLENDNWVANDTVLIRFRLWSDQLSAGWGWAIDNIKIQKKEKTTGLSHFNEEVTDNMLIYPNPANGQFNIEYKSEQIIGDINISVFSVDGKLVYSKNMNIQSNLLLEQVNLQNVQNGYYVVKLKSDKKTKIDRIVIK